MQRTGSERHNHLSRLVHVIMAIISIGAPGATRTYSVVPGSYSESNADPIANRVDTSGEFKIVDGWSEWVMENWQAGLGHVDPTSGGFLYAECETRIKNKIFLSPRMGLAGDSSIRDGVSGYASEEINSDITIGSSGTYEKVALWFAGATTVNGAWLFLYEAEDSINDEITVELRDGNDVSSASLVDTGTITPTAADRPGGMWYHVDVSGAVASPSAWLIIYPTTSSSITFPNNNGGLASTDNETYDGASWSADSTVHVYHAVHTTDDDMGSPTIVSHFKLFNSNLYLAMSTLLWKKDAANEDQWDLVSDRSNDIVSLEVWNNELYIAKGTNGIDKMTTGESFSNQAVNTTLLKAWGQNIYRSYQNDLYYSSDGSTWSSAIQVGPDGYEIRGMAGLNQDLYMSTDQGLYILAPGDIPYPLIQWDSTDQYNGVSMVTHENAIYMIVNNRVVRFSSSGLLEDIWIRPDDGIANNRIGYVHNLTVVYGQVWASVQSSTEDIVTVWAWNGEGWHHVAMPHHGATATALTAGFHPLLWDRTNGRVYTVDNGVNKTFALPISTHTNNPLRDSSSEYRPFGWIEWDKFWGGPRVLQKDWESISIWGDNLSVASSVDVYYISQDVVGIGGSITWQLLGSITSDGQELRWDQSSVSRPNSQWLKLGLLLKTTDRTATPVIESVVVKFLAKYPARKRWQFDIEAYDNKQEPDGTVNDYTGAQQRSHLTTMQERVPPFIFTDIDGTSYEVSNASRATTIVDDEYYNSSNQYKTVHRFVIEMVTDSAYSP